MCDNLSLVNYKITNEMKRIALLFLFVSLFAGHHARSQNEIRQDTASLVKVRQASSQQDENIFPQIIPPSPNASSLGVFGEVPVGHYSGIPNISIPLYEITSGRIKVPLSLSYHASGIRVSQEASWVGLGWALNAGGVISRSVSGVDDLNDVLYKGTSGYPATSESFPTHTEDGYFTDEHGNHIEMPPYYYDYMTNTKDVKPDVFYYSFDSYNGQMVFPKKSYEHRTGMFPEPMILNQDQLTVNYHRDGAYEFDAGEWVVITPDGTRYHFKTAEQTRTYCDTWSPPSNPVDKQPQVYTAWYLDEITNPYGDSVEFIYKKNAKIRSQVQGFFNKGFCRNPNAAHIQEWFFDVFSYSVNVVDEIVLHEIRFREGRIVFETSDREDLLFDGTPKPQALASIRIENNNLDVIKRFDLETGYYNEMAGTASQLRLRLDKVVENNEKTWTFTYDNKQLPEKNSVAIDYWGYANGMYRNAENLRRNSPFLSDIPHPHFLNPYFEPRVFYPPLVLGADRNASAEHAQTGILKRIDYPTGGYTAFEYELHDFYNHDLSFIGSDFKYGYAYYDRYVSEDSELELEFTVQDCLPCYAYASVFYSGFQCRGSAEYPYIDYSYEDFTDLDITWELFKKDDDGEWKYYMHNTFGNIECRQLQGKNEARLLIAPYFEPGEYRIHMPTYMNTRAGVELVIPHIKSPDEHKGGGLRIKNIKSYDGTNTVETDYRYVDRAGNTSGKVHAFPRTVYIPPVMATLSYGQMSSNVFSLGSAMSGIAVGYDMVFELQKNNDSTVYTREYWFHNQIEDFGHTDKSPNTPSEYHHENGLPKSIITRDSRGNRIQEKYYEYVQDTDQRDFIEGLNIVSLNHPGDPKVSLFNFYEYPSEWWYLDSERTIDYASNGMMQTETKKYEYDPEHHKVVSVRTSYRDGKDITENYSFAYLPGEGTIPHMVELPYEQNAYAGTDFLKGLRYVYNENFDLSETYVKGPGQSDYERRLHIELFDKYHNPVYLLKDETEKVVYLWGYRGGISRCPN